MTQEEGAARAQTLALISHFHTTYFSHARVTLSATRVTTRNHSLSPLSPSHKTRKHGRIGGEEEVIFFCDYFGANLPKLRIQQSSS